jgi:2-dehydropantoate 2-reductase
VVERDEGSSVALDAAVLTDPAELGGPVDWVLLAVKAQLYDRQAGRELEWDARNGVVRRLGRRHGIPTPVSDVIVPLLAAASGGQ